ncbi:hypothetical protein AGMMS50239_10080 [Bacteroidia bacterium]|nr:hypothetical protein AGMMS50239_10080 [Bacteroidia bacterium]
MEEKAAIFLGYSRSFGKWQFQTGIRYEYTFMKSTEDSVKRININRSSHRFYPSLALSRTFENNMETGLSFARRVKRPSFSQLNSNNYYINRFLLQKGNPMLTNEDIYQADSYLRYKIFDFNLGYVYKKNPIGMNIKSNHINSGQTVMTYTNYPKYQEINALFTGSLKYKIIRSQINLGLQQSFFNINYQGIKQDRNQMSFLYEMNNDVVFPKNYIFSLNFVYQGKSNEYATKKGEYESLDIGLRKSFFKNKLLVNLQVSDIFEWIKDKTVIETNDVAYIQRSKYETRFLILTLNYRFNNSEKKYRGKNASEDDIRRL